MPGLHQMTPTTPRCRDKGNPRASSSSLDPVPVVAAPKFGSAGSTSVDPAGLIKSADCQDTGDRQAPGHFGWINRNPVLVDQALKPTWRQAAAKPQPPSPHKQALTARARPSSLGTGGQDRSPGPT